MTSFFEAARKKRDELVRELEKLNKFLETYQELAIELQLDEANENGTSSPPTDASKVVDKEQKEAAREAEALDAPPTKRVRVSDNPPASVVIPAAIEVIRAAGRPLSRKEVREGLIAQGVVVNGKDPVKTMGTILWRAPDHIIQVEGRGYWPKADPVPPPRLVDIFGGRPL